MDEILKNVSSLFEETHCTLAIVNINDKNYYKRRQYKGEIDYVNWLSRQLGLSSMTE